MTVVSSALCADLGVVVAVLAMCGNELLVFGNRSLFFSSGIRHPYLLRALISIQRVSRLTTPVVCSASVKTSAAGNEVLLPLLWLETS